MNISMTPIWQNLKRIENHLPQLSSIPKNQKSQLYLYRLPETSVQAQPQARFVSCSWSWRSFQCKYASYLFEIFFQFLNVTWWISCLNVQTVTDSGGPTPSLPDQMFFSFTGFSEILKHQARKTQMVACLRGTWRKYLTQTFWIIHYFE